MGTAANIAFVIVWFSLVAVIAVAAGVDFWENGGGKALAFFGAAMMFAGLFIAERLFA